MRVAWLLALAACEKTTPPTEASWWCWPDSGCFAVRDRCETARQDLHIGGGPCEPQATAYCKTGCKSSEGSRPACSPLCGATLEFCQTFRGAPGHCNETLLPRHAELWPEYTDPGWWCWSLVGPTGVAASECVKHREHCAWDLADTLVKMGRVADATTCARPSSPPWCWSYNLDGKPTYVCSVTQDACEGARVYAHKVPTPEGHTRTDDAAECTPWAYD